MTDLEKLVLEAVQIGYSQTGLPRHVHVRYLPEVLALVCKGKLKLIKADANEIIVDLVDNTEVRT